MNLETKITIYKFTPQVFTLTLNGGQRKPVNRMTETIKYCVTNQKHLVMVNILSCYVSVKTENSQSFSFIVSFPELNMKH